MTLTHIAKFAPLFLARAKWHDNGTDTAFDNVLDSVVSAAANLYETSQSPAQSLVGVEQFKKNVTKRSASDFVGLRLRRRTGAVS